MNNDQTSHPAEKDIVPLWGSMCLRHLKRAMGRAVIPRLPMTRHVFNHIRWEINAILVNLNNVLNPCAVAKIRSIVKQDNLSVNVASGPLIKEGWVNIDLTNIPNISLRYDCRKKLPFRKNTVARIRCEQFLEHLDRQEEAPFFLQSALRCLNKGGVLRIAVPDAELYLRTYVEGDKEKWSAIGWNLDALTDPIRTPMDIINHVFRQEEEHRYAYDFETLESLLKGIGFSKVIKQQFGESVDPMLCDDLEVHKLFSLYVDATK